MSRITLSPFVNFQGRAREAMEFYHGLLGGRLELQTMNAQGESAPAGPGDRITHARLNANGVVIIATDGHPDYPAAIGQNVAMSLSGNDTGRLTRIFNGLAEGGRTNMPLTPQGNVAVGWLVDRFGINWTVNIAPA